MGERVEHAILAGGCFWGLQDLFRRHPGVVSTRVGYSGGDVPDATYRNPRLARGGDRACLRSRADLVPRCSSSSFGFTIPTVNRQGNDIGTSYRSAIFYVDDDQRRITEETIAAVEASGRWPGKVVTEVSAAGPFWEASPSIRTISSGIPTVTPATSCVRTGCCPSGRGRRADPGFALTCLERRGVSRRDRPSVTSCYPGRPPMSFRWADGPHPRSPTHATKETSMTATPPIVDREIWQEQLEALRGRERRIPRG